MEISDIQENIKDGWVYGSLIWNNGDPWIVGDIADWDDEYIAHEWWVNVNVGTVGQFTGVYAELTDNEKIYSGDIIEVYTMLPPYVDHSKLQVGVVIFEDGCFKVKLSDGSRAYPFTSEAYLYYKIIGNVYDNPELAKEIENV